jgi:predicted secreted protein
MGWVTGPAVYFILWWLVLFMVLPFGVRRHEDDGQGYDAGAPVTPRIGLKMAITSVIALVLWLIVYYVERYGFISLTGN